MLSQTVIPEGKVDKSVTYVSTDTSVATVTPKTGKVTAVAEGETTIEASNGLTVDVIVTGIKEETEEG